MEHSQPDTPWVESHHTVSLSVFIIQEKHRQDMEEIVNIFICEVGEAQL